ncbi:MAG: antirepresssor protein RebB [Alphaproteobacteria bacterium]|nr:MAG: antirepresssor protein RebB [Alphaproteobacteria bacterium]
MPDYPEHYRVNPQVTDAVTQSNVKVLADGPAIAMGTIYQSLAQATGLMFQNAVTTQNSQNILQQAATTQGVIQLFSVDTLADADASVGLAESLAQILRTGT